MRRIEERRNWSEGNSYSNRMLAGDDNRIFKKLGCQEPNL